ncbi:MAG: hypothetical protein QOJ79_1657 [Actinomycetota bacterium]|jgi:Asp-tRNA(Asn)/Glu-tRNA(Gln) amidotransferase A subunit family amidase|nr:hypothetical protein [Actinomycetota bacterium]
MTVSAAVERAVAAVTDRESDVQAWARLDIERAGQEAIEADRASSRGALSGLVLAVKDNIDRAGLATGCGSQIPTAQAAKTDAWVVDRLRSAGAVCLGKTVSTEFALFFPGPTRNPWRLTHTPGGSSSGSAAAIAAGMADIALGTQTGGSVIRPASFCGVWGFKPTFGAVPREGIRVIAPSLDTVGWFGRSAADLEAVRRVLGDQTPPAPIDTPPRFALLRTEYWTEADRSARTAVTTAADRARTAGARVTERDPAVLAGLAQGQPLIQCYEAARSLRFEREHHANRLSASLKNYLAQGDAVSCEQHEAVLASAARVRTAQDEVFDDGDVLLTLAAAGEAPKGLTSTGDPLHSQLWTLLGWPTVAVPGLKGSTGLPIAVQLIGRAGFDAEVIAAAAWLAEAMRA